MCSAASGDANSTAQLGKDPPAVVAPGGTEDLPERGEVGGVLDHDLVVLDVHPLESVRRRPDGGALPVDEGDEPVRVVGIDNAAAPVAQGPALTEEPGVSYLERLDVHGRIENLDGGDDRVRDRDEVRLAAFG